jgi:gliding motility-associated-like protein
MKKNTFSLICYKNLLILLFLIVASKGIGQVNSINVGPSFCRDASNQTIPIPVVFGFVSGTTGFSLEVSDANGNNFNTVIGLNPVTLPSNRFNFIMPSTYRGFGYKFRVKSLNPPSSIESNATVLFFRGYTPVLTYIPDVPNINFCGGGSFLRVDESPIGIPNLIYRWYKGSFSLGTGVLIPNQTSSTLFIDNITLTAGTYYAEIDYGPCNPTINNSINVIFPGGSFATIFSTLGLTLTTGQITDLKVTPLSSGETYQWYLNNNLIVGATSAIYPTGVAGTYKCLVINSSCQGFTSPLTLNVVSPQPLNSAGAIQNVVSPNGDGKNDTWELEQLDYGPNTNTEITIVSSQGETVLKTNAYTNNWPTQTIDFGAINPVYYYIISKQGQDDKKGSITLIK